MPITSVTVETPKTPVKKTTKKAQNKRPHKYIDNYGNKCRYVRFWFRVPNFEAGDACIKELFDKKIIDWSYVHGYEYPANLEKGFDYSVTLHGILRVPDPLRYDFSFFRSIWPKAMFKYGFYPENVYPRKKEAQVPIQNVQEQELPATQIEDYSLLSEGQINL